jgi:hypothetical protein
VPAARDVEGTIIMGAIIWPAVGFGVKLGSSSR